MKIIVENIAQEIRLDRYLKRRIGNIPQALIEKSLRNKKILVNEASAKSSTRVYNGDIISYDISFETEEREEIRYSNKVIKLAKEMKILFEDQNLIVIDKPHNLAVQGGTNISYSLNDALSYLNSLDNLERSIVHRLDKDTTGVLLIAKNKCYAAFLSELFREKKISKKYIAIIEGTPKKKSGYIHTNIAKKNKRMHHSNDGKPSSSYYEVISQNETHALLMMMPITGRTHQLRLHATSIGKNIVGDDIYGEKSNLKMMLHSYQIKFDENIFEAKIPKHFQEYFYKVFNSNIDIKF